MSVTKELDNLEDRALWHWRDSMRVVRFFNFDARLSLLVPILLLYPRISTLVLTVVMIAVFYTLERYGLTFPAALRAIRVWMVGPDRAAWPFYRTRRMRDFGAT
jgi:intracellular multiplication protein IcmT